MGGLIRLIGKPKLDVTRNSFRCRAANQYNQLTADIRKCPTLASFNIKAKNGIKENVYFSRPQAYSFDAIFHPFISDGCCYSIKM